MVIDFDYYKVFCYVAKYKKISIAAEKLFVTQPAVTQIINKLEEILGENLLIRNQNGIELTESGTALYLAVEESVKTLENVDLSLGKYKRLEKGTIKIRTGSELAEMFLYDTLEKFGNDYPNIKIHISSGAPSESLELLHDGEIDIILTYLPYDTKYTNVQAIELCPKDYIFAMSKKYFQDNNVKIETIEDLNKYSLIVPKKHSAIGELFNKKYGNIIKNFHYEISQEQMKKEFIMRNMGIGFLIKDEINEEIEKGDAIMLNIPDSIIKESVGVIIKVDRYSTYATKKLIEYLKNNYYNI